MGIVDFRPDFTYDVFGVLFVSGLIASGFITLGAISVFVCVSTLYACVAAGTVLGGGSVEADCSTVSGLACSSTVWTAYAGSGSNFMSELPTCAEVLSRAGSCSMASSSWMP